MALNQKDILMRLIAEDQASGPTTKVVKTFDKLADVLTKVEKTQKIQQKTQEKTIKTTVGMNSHGEQYKKIVETITPLQQKALSITDAIEKSMPSQIKNQQMWNDIQARGLQQSRKVFDAKRKETWAMEDAAKKGPGFAMEYLGIMFAGMSLQRTMAGLTQTAKDWLGMNELISTALGVTMLPAMTELLNTAVLPLTEGLMNLPESVQMGIGVSALTLEAVGGLASTIGQAGLAMNALEQFGMKKGTGGKIALGAIGVTIAISSFTSYLSGLSTETMTDDIISSIGTGLGVGVLAIGAGAAVGTGIFLGTIAAAALVSISLYTKFTKAEQEKVDIMKAAGISEKDINEEVMKDISIPKWLRTQGMDLKSRLIDLQIGRSGVVRNEDLSNQNFMSFAVGTQNVPRNGLYQLHQGETVLRKDQAQGGQNITIQYNITASSMQEFENKLRESERRITSDIRRMSR